MRSMWKSILFLGVIGLIGCSDSESGLTDLSKLKAPDAEQQEEIKKFDAKINQEEFGKPMPGTTPPARR